MPKSIDISGLNCGCAKKSDDKVKQLEDGRKLQDHTSNVFFKGTISEIISTGQQTG